MDPATEQALVVPTAYNLEVPDFLNFLDAGLKQYKSRYAGQ
jgi:hypothetical protein